jgi:hypothetical protein
LPRTKSTHHLFAADYADYADSELQFGLHQISTELHLHAMKDLQDTWSHHLSVNSAQVFKNKQVLSRTNITEIRVICGYYKRNE